MKLPPLAPEGAAKPKLLICHVRDRSAIDGALVTFSTVWDAAPFAGKVIAQPDLFPPELTRIPLRERARFLLLQRLFMGGKPFAG